MIFDREAEIILIKIWLEVGMEEQERRFQPALEEGAAGHGELSKRSTKRKYDDQASLEGRHFVEGIDYERPVPADRLRANP